MDKFFKKARFAAVSSMLLSCNQISYAAPTVSPITPTELPSTVMPERAIETLATSPTEMTPTVAPETVHKNQQAPGSLGEAATKIKFQLNKIILQGNHVYTEAQLSPLYKDKLHKIITVAELQNVVQDITNYYRNHNYVLTRAVLPPQHVSNGVVIIQVIEGYIDTAKVVGSPKGSKSLVAAITDKIVNVHPLDVKQMEHYLLIANEIPGTQVKAVLEPSKSHVGASDLELVTQTKTGNGYISYDNFGTRYIGPNEVTAGGELDSIFLPGDSTQFNVSRTTRPQELKFLQALYNMPIGSNGGRLIFNANQALTRPGFILTPLKIDGDAATFYAMLQYPLIRTREQSMTLDAGFYYIDSRVLTLPQGATLYADHLRTLRGGIGFDFSDSWYGSNSTSVHVEQGLEVLGATPVSQASSGFTSRIGGSGHFTKMELQYSRSQQFGTTHYAAFFIAKGQWALQPLLAGEQFAFGGVQQALGRGYDSAEIIGDRGLAGSIELRMNLSPAKYFMQAAQFYIFYDAGVIWNAKNVIGQLRKQSATSAGVGSRMVFGPHVSGNVLWAQPLTRPVDALALIKDGRQSRVFFSITASG